MSYRGSGLARVDADHPEAFAVCDRCGTWRNKSDLVWQYDYRGNALTNLRILVCQERERCNDLPFEFFRPIIVGPDPVPIKDPRPEPFGQDYGLQGFTLYTLWNGPFPPGGMFTKAQVISTVASFSEIPTPVGIGDESTVLVNASVAYQIVPANASRSWLLIYNPGDTPVGISTGIAVLGRPPTINLGYGEAMFWATAQDTGAVYQGAMTAVCPLNEHELWVWEAPYQPQYLVDPAGNFVIDPAGNFVITGP